MGSLFLEELSILGSGIFGSGGENINAEAALAFIGVFLMFFLFLLILLIVICIASYIYSSFAFMQISKKARVGPIGIAWIPLVGKPLLASKIAKMHWWPILLLIGFWVPFLNIFLILTFAVFYYIWVWKTFEAVGRPGWWVLLALIPFAGYIVYLVMLGIAAWGRESASTKSRK